jgi:hypothetical protein
MKQRGIGLSFQLGFGEPHCVHPFPDSLHKERPSWPSLRASRPHSFIVFLEGGQVWSPTARVQRGSSETARCTSTEDHQAPSPPLPHLSILSEGAGIVSTARIEGPPLYRGASASTETSQLSRLPPSSPPPQNNAQRPSSRRRPGPSRNIRWAHGSHVQAG